MARMTLFMVSAIGLTCLFVPNEAASLTSPPKLAKQCDTDECIVDRLESATSIMRHRESDTDPCDNFYRHVCGNYDEVSQTKERTYFDLLINMFVNKLIGIEDAVTSGYKPFKLIEDMHDTCMDEKARGQQSVDVMKGVIAHLGGWPVLEGDKWKEAEFDWMDFAGKAKESGYSINYFVDWMPKLKANGDERNLIFELILSPIYFEFMMAKDHELPVYQEYITKIAIAMGLSAPNDKELDEIWEFEKKLHAIDLGIDDDSTTTMTVADAQKKWPDMDWNNFVSKTLTPFADKGEEPMITVWNSAGMTKFINLMASTPKRVQANYAIWRLIQESVPLLTSDFTKEQEQFWKFIDFSEQPAEKVCDSITKDYMDEAVTYYFMEQFKASSDIITNMVDSIKSQMVKMMQDSKTVSDEDKQKGVKALTDIAMTIGPSEKLSDKKELENLYAEAEVDKTNWLKTLLQMNMFRLVLDYSSKLSKDLHDDEPVGDEKPGSPDNVDDHLYIPAQMMESTTFDENRPMYMNYGASGFEIANEIFDSVKDIGKSEDQTKCFNDLLSNLTDPDTKTAMTVESVSQIAAKYIGLRAAYAAYKEFVAQSGVEMPLPEVPYTPEQLFWISNVGTACQKNVEDPEHMEGTDMTLNEFVVMKVLSNVPEISNDFSCAAGSNMNPEHKCTWW